MTTELFLRRRLLAAAALVVAGAAVPAAAQAFALHPVVRTGDPVPGGLAGEPDEFTFFAAPSVNGNGIVAFRSQTTEFGVFTGTPGMVRRVATGSDPAPGLPPGSTFDLFDDNVPINSRGAVAFTSVYDDPTASTGGRRGAWANPAGVFQNVVLPGDALPGHAAGGTFSSFGTNFNPVVIADDGTVAYNAWTSTFPNAGKWGIWAGKSKAATVKVALADDPAPTLGANVVFDRIDHPVINPSGTLAFRATVKGSGTTFYDRDGIWAGPAGAVRPVVRSDAAAPGTAYKFAWFGAPDISSTGKVAFKASLETAAPIFDRDGIWAGSSAAGLTLIARTSSTADAPGAPGARFQSLDEPLVNAAGTVSFAARLTGTGITSANNKGLWIGTSAASLSLVARTGDAAPGTSEGVRFASPTDFAHALNDLGQVAFTARVTGTGVTASNDNGLWVYDPIRGTRLVAREGQTVPVSLGVTRTISSIELRTGASSGDGRATSLNDNGLVAFTLGFTSGINYGVFVADVGGVLPGDANQNGTVDDADLAAVLGHMNRPGTFATGDFNADGLVDFADFQILERNFGKSVPAFAPGVDLLAVETPEPGLAVLGVVAVGALLRRGRRRVV
jgi:hypothetical protein